MSRRNLLLIGGCAVVALVGIGIWLKSGHAQGPGGMPAMPVSVAQPVKRQVADWVEFPGRFEAAALVEIRAQVSGVLDSVHFKDGGMVKKGDLLFVIDPRPYEAALKQAQANVEIAKTRLDLTSSDMDRAKDLRKTGNIPESNYQQRQQQFLEARGGMQAAQAAFEKARLDLEYTQIRAPISGRIGRKEVNEGNLIASGSSGQPLTTIVSDDPIHFYFDVDERNYLIFKRNLASSPNKDKSPAAYIAAPDEQAFGHAGTIDYTGNLLDNATGTIRVRAVVPNADSFLTPGLFGRVRVAASAPYEALILPDEAVGIDQTRRFVMVAGQDGTVGIRPVEVGPRIAGFRVIRSGLKGDEQVIVNGLMRARPGGKVMAQPTELKVPEDMVQPGLAK